MPTFHAESVMPCDARTLYDWHARPGALERLQPPWQRVRVVERTPGADHPRIGEGARVRLQLRMGPWSVPWIAQHADHRPGERFTDRQLVGPFDRWVHEHRFESVDERTSRLVDHVSYQPPGGALGAALLGGRIRRELDRLFWYRHRRTRLDLARHAHGPAPMTVAIAGSSGMIGSALAAFLATGGHRVVRLVRRRPDPAPLDGLEQRWWNPHAHEICPYALAGVDAVVNLCGQDVSRGRWTPARRTQLLASRVRPTRTLADAIASLPSSDRPRVLINASGAHAYGQGGDRPLTEADGPGDGFLAHLVQRWEAATRPAQAVGVRVVHARLGIVLGATGGVLARLRLPTLLGLAGPIGSGRQWWPWIGLDDAIGAIHHMLASDRLHGPVNVCAPNAATANDVIAAIAQALRRPSALGLPAGVARCLLGRQKAQELLLASLRAEPRALEAAGFRWLHPTLLEAVGWELGIPHCIQDIAQNPAHPADAASPAA